jgi:hypothetical protein
MKCEEAEALLDLHLGHELPQELSDKLDRHLLRCARCAGEMRSLEQVCDLLHNTFEPAQPSPSYRERALARLNDQLAPNMRPVEGVSDGRQWVLPFLPAKS